MFKPLSSIINHSYVLKGTQFIFALILFFFACRLLFYHYCLATFPYPNTYREGASMATTAMFLHGINPYHFTTEPQYTNIYGILYPLIAWPFTALFGLNVVIYRIVAALFIFASCLVVFLVLQKRQTPLLLNCWAVLIFYASLLYPLTSTPCADPASTGLFFMLLALYIPFLCNESNRSLLVAAFCGVLAFYAKPYFAIGIPVVVSYMFLFYSKRKAFVLGFYALVFFLISVVIMNSFFPSYFDDCLFIHNNYAQETSMMIVLERQLHAFFDVNKGAFILLLILLCYSFKFWRSYWNYIKEMPLDVYAAICFGAVLVLSLGRHYGANLWYFFQLFTPFMVIMAAVYAGRFKIWPVLFSILLVLNLFNLTSDDHVSYFNKNSPGWHQLDEIIQSQANIFNTALIAPVLIKANKEVYDDGQTEYFFGGGERRGLMAHFFKEDKRVNETQQAFMGKIVGMLQSKQFDVVIIEAGYSSPVLPGIMSNYYKFIGSVVVNSPQDRKLNLLTIWRPI